MPVVLDANLLVALAGDDARAPAVTALLQHWTRVGKDLHAPALLPYEVANGITRLVTEQLGAELWTLDGPLARNAIGVGFPVHLVQ